MAKPRLDVDVSGNVKPLERQLKKVQSKGVNLNLDSKNFSAPLGKIKGELGEFDKSLAASNARVLAFGASAGAIYAIQRALSETVTATIQVEKSLAEVNVILGTSTKKLNTFGNELFNIAKKTGRSFNDVALAAGELARQGLAMEETLKRTADAMTLARLSGLGVEESVNAITAALNGFRNAALTSTAVIDKIIAVDQAFAVSGADLAEALRRVGSTAEGAGVSLDELLGIVTAAQQITARGGAVIGNSFKTIFTRIQRPRVLKALDELGVKTKNAAGASLSATQVLKNLANTFDTLSESQQAQIAELVGGVFQINVLKASLRDLGSQYSVFSTATDISAKSSGEAARRNAQLNKTLSAGLNETLQNLTKLAAGIGKLTLEPAIRNVLDIVNSITEKLSFGEAEGAGQKIGKALLGGLGKFLSGPGLALAAVALFQLFNNLRKFAVDALRTFTGLNATFKQQQQLQQGIVNILQQNPQILAQIQRGEISVDQAAKQILGSYKGLNAELVSMNNLAAQLAANMSKAGAGVGTVAGRQTITSRNKASGYVPNFADQGEVAAMALSGMYTKGQMANPQTRRGRVYDGRGGSFMATYNGHEKKQDFIGPNGKKATIIASPEMQKAMARGFIPNFVGKLNAASSLSAIQKSNRASDLRNIAAAKNISPEKKAAANKRLKTLEKRLNRKINVGGQVGFIASQLSGGGIEFSNNQAETRKFLGLKGKRQKGEPEISARPVNMPIFTPRNLKADGKIDEGIAAGLRKPIANAILETSRKLFSPMEKELPDSRRVDKYLKSQAGKEKLSLTAGNIFEDAINAGLNLRDKTAGRRWDYVRSDFNKKGKMLGALVGSGRASELKKLEALEAKLTYPPSNIAETRAKFFDPSAGPKTHRAIQAAFADITKGKKAGGYNPLGAALKRENQAGVTKSAIRIGKDRRLATGANPFGLAVTNTRDEPRGIKDVLARGYIPNFAKDKGGGGGGGGDASGKVFAAMMGLSMVSNMFAAGMEDANGEVNKFATGINSAMNAAMVFATATMLLPGPMGIVAGLLGGVAVGLTSYMNEVGVATQAQKDNAAALNAATVRLQEKSNAIQGAQQALSAYEASLASGDAKQVQAAQKKYSEALSKLTPALRAQVLSKPDKKDQAAVLADAASTTARRGQQSAEAEADQKAIIDALNKLNKDKNQSTLIKIVAGIAVTCLAILASQKIGKAMKKVDKARIAERTANAKTGKLIKKGAPGVNLAKGKGRPPVITKTAGLGKGTRALAGLGRVLTPLIAIIGKALAIFAALYVLFEVGSRALKYAVDRYSAFAKFFAGAAKKLGFNRLSKAFSGVSNMLGKFSGFLGGLIDKFSVVQFFKDKAEVKAIKKQLASKYIVEGQEGESGMNAEGRKQLKSDASNLLERVDPKKLTEENLTKLRKAANVKGSNADREDAMIKALEEMGVAAEEAETYVRGAGAQTYALALEMTTLQREAAAAAAQTQRLQAALDAQAAAAAASAAVIANTNRRANDFTRMMRTFAKGLQDARKQTAQFNREFSMEVLKGGAKLAEQFSTSFQNTRRQGDIKKLEVNNKAALDAQKIREEGSKKLFEAISKQKEIADLFKRADEGGKMDPKEIALVNQLRDLPNALAGQGAGGLLNGILQTLNAAAANKVPGADKINFAGEDLGSILMEQTNKLAEAERTRLHQLRLTELQTRLQQEQNRIDQQAKAGGGIQAFLDSESLNKMEDGFNQAVDGFVTASNRGDTVKTGQFAGNLLGNLNEFVGADLMGPAAESLKDQVQKGLAQSLQGRAFARADVLDQAAAQTGNTALSDLANTLRNQNFAEIAATQTALEFKRQKMPANIENMLAVQRSVEAIQRQDAQSNFRTAENTLRMADYLTGGNFSTAAANIVANMPPPQVRGLDQIAPTMQAAAQAMQDSASALQNAATINFQADRLGKLGEKKSAAEAELERFIEDAQYGGIDEAEAAKIQTMIAGIARMNNDMSGIITDMGPMARAAMGDQFVNDVQQEQLANQYTGLLGGQNFNASQMNAADFANLPPTVQHALEQIQDIMRTARPTNYGAGINFTTPNADGVGVSIAPGEVGQSVGDYHAVSADGIVTANETRMASTLIGQARDKIGQAGSPAEQMDMINAMIRQARVDAGTGRKGGGDVAALRIEALQTMLERIEQTGSLNKGQSNAEFFKEMIDKINQQIGNTNATFVINVPNSLTGQVETVEIQQQIQLLQNQVNNMPAAQVGAPVSAPNTNP
jgi:TP901 family phage tail tape measure protein